MTTGSLELDGTAGDDGGFTVPGPALGYLGQPGARLHIVVEQRPRQASMHEALRGLPGPKWSSADQVLDALPHLRQPAGGGQDQLLQRRR